jgi:uroporphyrinogen decarboxylase
MTSRERVIGSLNHEEPDRLPLFKPNIIDTERPYETEMQAFLDTFEFDAFADLGDLVRSPHRLRETADGELRDGYGCRFRYMGVGMPYCVHSPLAEMETVPEIEAFAWPDPDEPGLIAPDARDKVERARDADEQAVYIGVGPIFHQYHYLRGFEQWMVDIAQNRGVHEAIAARICHINTRLIMRLLDEVGDLLDIVAGGDDFGTSTASYMAPEDFRSLIKPFYRDMIGAIKGRFPHLKYYMHSHGQIMDLVPDLIECGVDILNPILPLDNMDPVRLKREFGSSLCFHGGIDIERILPFGTLHEVRDHVRRVIDILAPGGGYWFKAQAISPVIPVRNLVGAYELAREYGRYLH